MGPAETHSIRAPQMPEFDLLGESKMNKGSYIEEEKLPGFHYDYRDYPKIPQQRTGYLQLSSSQSIEEEVEDITINTQGTYDQPSDKNIIDVYLRIKPSKSRSNPYNENVLEVLDQKSIMFKPMKDMKCSITDTCNLYRFSNIYGPHTTQAELFQNIVHNMLERYLNGEDALLFSFGTTNSGKTFTIQGTIEQPGIIPRTLNILFNSLGPYLDKSDVLFRPTYASNVSMLSKEDRVQAFDVKKQILNSFDQSYAGSTFTTTSTYYTADDSSHMFKTLDKEHSAFSLTHLAGYHISVWISFYEVYNENVFDLLDVANLKPPKKKTILKIGRDQNQDVYIKDLTYVNVHSCEEAYRVLRFGKSHLSVAPTELNHRSSRSHCVFSIKLVKVDPGSEELIMMSSFDICDLAGAERQKRAHTSGDRLREARTINSSLHVLARCFNVLRENNGLKADKKKLIPFRDSKLTQIFQRSLSGLSSTVKMIVNVNASPAYAEETVQVLKISSVARDLLTVAKPRHLPPPPPRKKTRFSIMAARNLDWRESDIVFQERASGEMTDYFQGSHDDPYETIRLLEARLAEFEGFDKKEFEYQIREEYREVQEDFRKMFEEQQTDWENNVKKLREQHEEDLERQRKFYKTQIETLMTLVKNQQAEDDSEDETLNESAIEAQHKLKIQNLKQELSELEAKYKSLSEEHEDMSGKLKELTRENRDLVTKNKELEGKVAQLSRRVEEMERGAQTENKPEEVKYLKSLLDEAKEEFKEQTAEIEQLRSEVEKLSEERRLLTVRSAELEYELEQRDYLIAVKTDGAEELQEKLDYMENKFQEESLVYERLMSEKENLISQLKADLESNRAESNQSAHDEQALQKEIKNLGSLLVDKDKTIGDLKAKIHKYEKYYAVMKEDRKTKEKDIAELKTKCEELTQQVTKLEADCQSYLNTIKNMENDERSTKHNQEKLLKIYEDRLKAVQDELAEMKCAQLKPSLEASAATPSQYRKQLEDQVNSLKAELEQRHNVVRDLQLKLLQKGEMINNLKAQMEKSQQQQQQQRSPLKGLENQMAKINIDRSPSGEDTDDPDFLPRSRCKSTSKKRQLKKPSTHLNSTAGLAENVNLITPRRIRTKLFNKSSDSSDLLKTPEDVPPQEAIIPSPKSQIKIKLRGRRKPNLAK
ncbi:hypothetical protein M8J75_003937 [Diaphorina citri]|nr:hypothetical protein M8J75_003937 [Diaphorina citri]